MKCFSCGKAEAEFRCSACRVAHYCGGACQEYAFTKLGHRHACALVRASQTAPIDSRFQNDTAFNNGAYYNFTRKMMAAPDFEATANAPNSFEQIPALVWGVFPPEARAAYGGNFATFEAEFKRDLDIVADDDEAVNEFVWDVESLIEYAWAALIERDRAFFSKKRGRDDADPFARAVIRRRIEAAFEQMDRLTDAYQFPRDLLLLVLEFVGPLDVSAVLRVNKDLTNTVREQTWQLLCVRDCQAFVDIYRAANLTPDQCRADFEVYYAKTLANSGKIFANEASFMAPVVGCWADDAVPFSEKYRRFVLLRSSFLVQNLVTAENSGEMVINRAADAQHQAMYMDLFADPEDDVPLVVFRYFEASCPVSGSLRFPPDQEVMIEKLGRMLKHGVSLDHKTRTSVNPSVLNAAIQRVAHAAKAFPTDDVIGHFLRSDDEFELCTPGLLVEIFLPDPARLNPKTVAFVEKMNREYRRLFFCPVRLAKDGGAFFTSRCSMPLGLAMRRIAQDLVMMFPRLAMHFSSEIYKKLSVDRHEATHRFNRQSGDYAHYEPVTNGITSFSGKNCVTMNRWHRQAVYRPFESFDPRPIVV